jgi:hypothetical protein
MSGGQFLKILTNLLPTFLQKRKQQGAPEVRPFATAVTVTPHNLPHQQTSKRSK